jgi:hypothetical protein
MKTLFILIISSLPFFAMAQQEDCMEKSSDLAQKSPIQVDTINTIHPDTYERTTKVIRIYHMGEVPIVKKVKEGRSTLHYIKKNDCLVIRHVEEMME